MDDKSVQHRVFVLVGVIVTLMALFTLRLVYLQVIEGDDLRAQAERTTAYKFNVTAARGEIVDRYGRSLATNETAYSVVLNQLMMGEADLNNTLMQLVEILQASGEEWNDTMLISMPDGEGHYHYTSDGSAGDENRLATLKEMMERQQYTTADEIMAVIVEEYELEEYSPVWQRILGGIRYQMRLEEFGRNNNFTLASGVSMRTVATVEERSMALHGVQIMEIASRTYPDGTVLPHVLGNVGKILREQWKVMDENGNYSYPLKEAGYKMSDLIGRDGLEKVYEDRLRGSDGQLQIVVDSNGNMQEGEMLVQPKPGDTLRTTIDLDFQKRVDEALEQNILLLQQTKREHEGQETNAGTVVVLDVKDNGILALSNYPSYDLNLYSTNYSEYAGNELQPLFNRALQGQYTPGSTFKPAVALAALANGTVTPDETVRCVSPRIYTYYAPTYTPRCAGFGHSGDIDMITGIAHSCNLYFYDVGRRVGVDKYNEMAEDLGLGVKTGVELGEAAGHLTSKEDENYTNGLEIQAAIGQGNTMVTPVQLATYASTIANKGVRYRTHLVSGFLDTNTGEIIENMAPVVEADIGNDAGVFDVVEQGMVGMAQSNGRLSSFPYQLAAKTGSPQRAETYTNGAGARVNYVNSCMIAYGPVDDPEIAVAIILEYGGGGSNAAQLALDIFNAYYFEKTSSMQPTQESVLLP